MEPLTDKVQEIVATLTTNPERQHYVNYTRLSSGENLYVGPYPYTVANLVKGYIKYCYCYTYPTLTLKPRKGYRKTTGPTNKEIEEVVVEWLKRDLEVYSRVLDWVEESRRAKD